MRRLVPIALALAAGCSSFSSALSDFDGVTQRGSQSEEPEQVRYDEKPRRLPWVVRQIGGGGDVVRRILELEPEPTPEDNPTELARDSLRALVAHAAGDGTHVRQAIAANRALWLAAADREAQNTLNTVEAVAAIERISRELGLEPLAVPLALGDPDTREEEARIAATLAKLEKTWPGQRAGRSLTASEIESHRQALEELTQAPLRVRKRQRSLLKALADAVRAEDESALIVPTRAALDRALAFALTHGLRDALRMPAPEVREAALLALHRLSGPSATPKLLSWIARAASRSAAPEQRYDSDPAVRRALVRICGQVDAETAVRQFAGGPSPAEFLYETATRDPQEGLRTIALEALALALRRPVDFESDWAELWWRAFVAKERKDT